MIREICVVTLSKIPLWLSGLTHTGLQNVARVTFIQVDFAIILLCYFILLYYLIYARERIVRVFRYGQTFKGRKL